MFKKKEKTTQADTTNEESIRFIMDMTDDRRSKLRDNIAKRMANMGAALMLTGGTSEYSFGMKDAVKFGAWICCGYENMFARLRVGSGPGMVAQLNAYGTLPAIVVGGVDCLSEVYGRAGDLEAQCRAMALYIGAACAVTDNLSGFDIEAGYQ